MQQSTADLEPRPAEATQALPHKYAHALVCKDTVVLVRHYFNDDCSASVSSLISELIERKSSDI